MTKLEQLPKGWVFGGFDGFAGDRIYPSWSGALEGKRLICRDIRLVDGSFIVHNPWTDTVDVSLVTIAEVEAYIAVNGKLIQEGGNVWD